MVTDELKNLLHYIPEQYCKGIKDFLLRISPSMEEKEYEIYGQHVFVRVMSYDTKEKEKCRIEAHDRYIDIQSTIVGAEGIDIFDRGDLCVEEQYQPERDVIFFRQDDKKPYVTINNLPGRFSMMFSDEAHRPQEKVDGYERYVKKFVIKLEVHGNGL